MKRLLIRLANTPLLVLLVLCGLAVQSSVFLLPWLRALQPDLVLLAVLWMAWRRGFVEGGVLTLLFAYCAELHSAVPQGLFLSGYMLIYLIARYTAHVFQIPHLKSYLVVTFIASITWKLTVLSILQMLSPGPDKWGHTLYLLIPGGMVEVFLGSILYRALDRLDRAMFKRVIADEENEGLNSEEGFV